MMSKVGIKLKQKLYELEEAKDFLYHLGRPHVDSLYQTGEKIMKKILSLILSFSLLFVFTGCQTSAPTVGTDSEIAPQQSQTAERSAEQFQNVPTAAFVTDDMLTAQYWIEKAENPSEVLMSSDEIKEFNENIKTKLADTDGAIYDLSSFPDTIDKDTLNGWMHAVDIPTEPCFVDGESVSDDFWAQLEAEKDTETLSEKNPIQYGVIVRRSNIRNFPSDKIVTDDPSDICFDLLQDSGVLLNEPVLVVHESKSKKWSYIIMYNYMGWVPTEDIAICETKGEWEKLQNFEDFIVVTGNKIYLEPDPYDAVTNELELGMGTKIEIAKDSEYPSSIGDRSLYENYVVKIPARGEDGHLEYHDAMIPVNRDVSRGYLPFTTEAVLQQAFKMLGDRYGWGGMLKSRDCSSFVLENYRCFGIDLPRNTSTQEAVPCTKFELEGKTTEEKYAILDHLIPGSLLFQPGHVTMYLGHVNDHYYVINACGGFIPTNSSDHKYMRTRSIIVNDLEVQNSKSTPWIELQTMANQID